MEEKTLTNKIQWERFIDRYAADALFQRWEWGEVNEKQQEKLFRIGFFQKKQLIGIAQCIVVKARRGNFLHVRHGPILAVWNQKVFSGVLQKLKRRAKQEHCVSVRISPRIQDSPPLRKIFAKDRGIPAAIHAMDAECAWVLDITAKEEALLADMRKTTRYEIRKAMKLGVEISISKDPTSIVHFMSLYAETSKRHGFVKHKGIEDEFAVYAASDNAVIITGSYEHVPAASALILFSGQQAIYHHGASIPSPVPVSYLVQWEAIRYAKERGVKTYNFWGIAPEDDPTHPWFGLTSFKKGFGGQEVRTIHAYDFPVSLGYWLLYLVEWMRKQIKGYS